MIYVTGECHRNFERFNNSIFPEQNEMTKDRKEGRYAIKNKETLIQGKSVLPSL